MNAEAIIRQLEQGILASPPAGITREQVERFFADQRPSLTEQLQPLERYIAKRLASQEELPPDEWTPAKRTAANLAAMKIAAANESGEALSKSDRAALRQYSGWGGLSVKDNLDKMPPQWRVGSSSLINEYYTPSKIAHDIVRALCPYLDDLKNRDGEVIALEPSVGIGRFVDALDRVQCEQDVPAVRWLATELNQVSARLFQLLHPDVEFQQGTFEQWVVDNYSRYSSNIGLVLSNPPFGQRFYKTTDQDREYNEERAEAYFMRRGLDMLKPGGIGVFMVPSGVLSGRGKTRDVRAKLLRHNHLMGAFRLPMRAVPGALLIIDIQFWRARDGVLEIVDSADEYILEGRYFEEHKDHVLGKEVGSPTDTDRGRFSYKVVGTYKKLPRLIERPMCSACKLVPRGIREAPRTKRKTAVRERASTEGLNPALASAVELGTRVLEYLREKSAGTERAVLLHADLNQALVDFQTSKLVEKHKGNKNPWQWLELRQLADGGNSGAQGFLQAWTKTGALVYAVTKEPKAVAKWPGDPDDVVAQANMLYRSRRELKIPELVSFHESVGGRVERPAMVQRLLAADFCFDSEDEQTLVPLKNYITGNLWPRHDLAARLAGASAQWKLQFGRLRGALKLATWTDIANDASPTQGWIPNDLLSEWLSETQNDKNPIEIIYREGLYQFKDIEYTNTDLETSLSSQAVLVLGWLNHDNVLFAPGANPARTNSELKRPNVGASDEDKETIHDYRRQWDWFLNDSFRRWVDSDDERRARFVDAYNRNYRGYVKQIFKPETLEIARWGDKITLHGYQVSGVRRLLSNRGGLLAYDVGLGKTYTGIAFIARAKQEGWARRPVVVVPGSLAFKWLESFQTAVPDFRVIVIGATRVKRRSGPEVKKARERLAAGELNQDQYDAIVSSSRSDTVAEQAEKWIAFMSGAYDAVILTRDALPRTRMSEAALVEFVNKTTAIRRSVKLTQRQLAEKKEAKKKKGETLTEREEAVLQEGVAAWVRQKLELRKGWEYVPGITWDDIGVDLLVVDEATDYKNLFLPAQRGGQAVRYMGSPGQGSKRAWAMQFRCGSVHARTGGAGVCLLSATPAKNSPIEFYNLIQYVDPRAWERVGLTDPERFIDRYIKIEYRMTIDSALDLKVRPVVTGFLNLDELRSVVFRYSEYKTTDDSDVNLVLPQARKKTIQVDLDSVQEAKYVSLLRRMEDYIANAARDANARIAILGTEQRLNSIAQHGQLADGYTWGTALEGGLEKRTVSRKAAKAWILRGWQIDKSKGKGETAKVVVTKKLPPPDPRSPKVLRIAQAVADNLTCGHIVFCNSTALHRWLAVVMAELGVPENRIAVLNAKTSTPADRQRVSRGFNGDPDIALEPEFDVVVANSVAYEGIDLQRRTCMIHHLDLPQTPMDLVQRNGRGYRQGNEQECIEIRYYLSRRSTDPLRMQRIVGKKTWISEFYKSSKTELSSPADESTSPDELLVELSRNPERTRKKIEGYKRERRERQKKALVRSTARKFQSASDMWRDVRRLRLTDPRRAQQIEEKAESIMADLKKGSREIWPWAEWIDAVRETVYLVPPEGGAPVHEGLRIVRRNALGREEQFEFGRIIYDSEKNQTVIGLRSAGAAIWRPATSLTLNRLALSPEDMPGNGLIWPDDDQETKEAIQRHIPNMPRFGGWNQVQWAYASDAFMERWWTEFKQDLIVWFRGRDLTIPVMINGELAVRRGAAIVDGDPLAPTNAGWREFQRLAPIAKIPVEERRKAAQDWWIRNYKIQRRSASAAPASAAPPTSSAPAATPEAVAPPETPATAPGEPLDLARYELVNRRSSAVLDTITRGLDVGGARKIGLGKAFMAVNVDRLDDDQFAVSHYYTQNGDPIADPDVEFYRLRRPEGAVAGSWTVLAIQQPMGYQRVAELDSAGVPAPNRGKSARELARFVNRWMQTILEQQGDLDTLTRFVDNDIRTLKVALDTGSKRILDTLSRGLQQGWKRRIDTTGQQGETVHVEWTAGAELSVAQYELSDGLLKATEAVRVYLMPDSRWVLLEVQEGGMPVRVADVSDGNVRVASDAPDTQRERADEWLARLLEQHGGDLALTRAVDRDLEKQAMQTARKSGPLGGETGRPNLQLRAYRSSTLSRAPRRSLTLSSNDSSGPTKLVSTRSDERLNRPSGPALVETLAPLAKTLDTSASDVLDVLFKRTRRSVVSLRDYVLLVAPGDSPAPGRRFYDLFDSRGAHARFLKFERGWTVAGMAFFNVRLERPKMVVKIDATGRDVTVRAFGLDRGAAESWLHEIARHGWALRDAVNRHQEPQELMFVPFSEQDRESMHLAVLEDWRGPLAVEGIREHQDTTYKYGALRVTLLPGADPTAIERRLQERIASSVTMYVRQRAGRWTLHVLEGTSYREIEWDINEPIQEWPGEDRVVQPPARLSTGTALMAGRSRRRSLPRKAQKRLGRAFNSRSVLSVNAVEERRVEASPRFQGKRSILAHRYTMYVAASGAESILRRAPEPLARRNKSPARGELAPIMFERGEVSYLINAIGGMRRRFEGVLPLLAAVHSETCLAGHVRRGDQYVLVGPPVAVDFDVEVSESLTEALAATVAPPERRQLNGLTRAFADALTRGSRSVRLSHALVEPCLEVARVLIAEWEQKQTSGSDVEMDQASAMLDELEQLATAAAAARDRIEHGLVTADADRVVVLPAEPTSTMSRLVRSLGRGEAHEQSSIRIERVAEHRFVLQREGLTIDLLRIPSDGSSSEAWTVLALEDSRGPRLLPLIVDIDDNPVAMRESKLREALERTTQFLTEASGG